MALRVVVRAGRVVGRRDSVALMEIHEAAVMGLTDARAHWERQGERVGAAVYGSVTYGLRATDSTEGRVDPVEVVVVAELVVVRTVLSLVHVLHVVRDAAAEEAAVAALAALAGQEGLVAVHPSRS